MGKSEPLEKQNDDTAGTGGASQGKVDVFLSQSASMLAAEVNEGWPTVCPVLAGAPVPVSPREWEKGHGRGRVASSCSVHAERTGGKADVVAQEKPLSPAAKGGWMKQSSEMPLDASGSGGEFLGCEPKGTPSVSESFATIFQINKLRSLSFEALCRAVDELPKNSLQVGISLAQLLLAHPRDGDHVMAFLRQTEKSFADTPTRRDLLPFQFCPAVGAAIKVISLFPVTPLGLVNVDVAVVKKMPRQQARKLCLEGMVQLWRWLVVTVLNGEYLDWCGAPTLWPAKPSLAQLAALEMIGEHVRDFCGSPLESWNLPNFRQLMQSKSLDYSGDEVTHALPLRPEELQPGLPDAAVGGSLDAFRTADNEVQAWLGNPEKNP